MTDTFYSTTHTKSVMCNISCMVWPCPHQWNPSMELRAVYQGTQPLDSPCTPDVVHTLCCTHQLLRTSNFVLCTSGFQHIQAWSAIRVTDYLSTWPDALPTPELGTHGKSYVNTW
jgi:hypothetical protein